MDDKNSSNVRHPLHAALMIFHSTLRTAFETAAAFWRPWFRAPQKKDVAAREQSKAAWRKKQPTGKKIHPVMAVTKRSMPSRNDFD